MIEPLLECGDSSSLPLHFEVEYLDMMSDVEYHAQIGTPKPFVDVFCSIIGSEHLNLHLELGFNICTKILEAR